MESYESYAIELRRTLHQHPEIGFDLPETLALVRRELSAMGIPFTERFGKSAIVATINEDKPGFTIGIRADMDALPLSEETDVPFRSRNPGMMHACGHDVHTATLLGTARCLNDRKDELRCRVKLLFTPAEEYTTPGCKLMAEDGVMDDIDCIVALHVDGDFDVGSVAVDEGGQGATSMGFTVEMFGQSAHAANQHEGRDAIMMCVKAYTAMEMMVAKEINGTSPRVLNIGAFNGGKTNNIVCDYCKMFGTVRTYEDDVNDYILGRIREIAESTARESGGRAVVEVKKLLPYVINHPAVTERMRAAAGQVVGPENVLSKKRGFGGEDFSFLCRVKPGMMYRLGIRNPEKPDGVYSVHNVKFEVDERCIGVGIRIFTEFVFENMDRIAF